MMNPPDVLGTGRMSYDGCESMPPRTQEAGEELKLEFPALTSREREVALLLAVGKTNREIAKDLGISIKTIDTHRGHILKKLELRNNVELARMAIREGYVQL